MKISVITVCRNEVKTIEETIKSVIEQSFKNIQFIIVDGDSTDGTKEIINKYRDKIDILIFDKAMGIYGAMNKAVSKASGDYVYFLNANDSFYNKDVVEKVFKNSEHEDIVYGNVLAKDEAKEWVNKYNKVNRSFLINTSICHQALFVKRSLFKEYGIFDTRYKVVADYDWLLRVLKRGVKTKYIDIIIANYRMGGISDNKKFRKMVLGEYDEVRAKYFSLVEIIIYKLKTFIIGLLVKLKYSFLE
jgi:glycosyltransferase involved in cell wall biosynthesis